MGDLRPTKNPQQVEKNAGLNSETKQRINPALPLIITSTSIAGVAVLGAVLQKRK